MIKAKILVGLTGGLLAVAAISATTATAAPAPGGDSSGSGSVTVIHAIRGLVADVSVDGKTVLRGFTAARVTDPLMLTAGRHTIVATSTSSGPRRVVLSQSVQIPPGSVSTAVVGLTTTGVTKLYVFSESNVVVGPSQAALVVRHAAALGGARLIIDGKVLDPEALTNGGSENALLSPGSHQALLRSATGATILPAQSVMLAAGQVTSLYLTGSQQLGTVAWLATVRDPQPNGVLQSIPTGDGSTAATAPWTVTDVSLWAGLCATLFAGVATALVLRRRTHRATV